MAQIIRPPKFLQHINKTKLNNFQRKRGPIFNQSQKANALWWS